MCQSWLWRMAPLAPGAVVRMVGEPVAHVYDIVLQPRDALDRLGGHNGFDGLRVRAR